MRMLKLSVDGSRRHEEFLIAVKPLNETWATLTLTDLLSTEEQDHRLHTKENVCLNSGYSTALRVPEQPDLGHMLPH
jgi:hypothetical protein